VGSTSGFIEDIFSSACSSESCDGGGVDARSGVGVDGVDDDNSRSGAASILGFAIFLFKASSTNLA